MKAMLHTMPGGLSGLALGSATARPPRKDEVQVRLKAAGLNHRDLFVMAAHRADDPPLIPGSDGAGIVSQIGEEVSGISPGDEVVILPTLGWERTADVPTVPDIVGGPTDGTLAEYITLPAANIFPKPSHLTWQEAAVLALSGLTAYRALFTRGRLQRGEHVLVPGIGGGVATFALLFALAAGATVTVSSRSPLKRSEALRLGATTALDSGDSWSASDVSRPVDLVIDGIGQAMFSNYTQVLRPGGAIVIFGASSGDRLDVPIRDIFFPQHTILGTSMGSREEFAQMLDWVDRHQIRPVVDRCYPLAETALAFERMASAEQFGNLAIAIDGNGA